MLSVLSAPTRPAHAATVRIETPRGGYTSSSSQRVEGSVSGAPALNRMTLVVNGIPQDVPVRNGRFGVDVVVSPGENILEARAAGASDRISFFARVPGRDVKIVLTWDDARYVDLWVTDPDGERCYWANPSTAAGGNLIANDETGFGPQIFTLARAKPGTYNIDVQYYSKGFAPVSRVKIYAVLYEGTPRERRMQWDFLMTRQHTVFHIGDFEIAPQ
ncbi:MAG: DUF2135 domain-containing protein [Spirochaetales bacterium]|nr:DUF2135 domain-containing protein [Leptospiraceae bacterium]MCP5483147.1 DUF2135 domain-containing protein [Spirochaetales bacterium]MCP5484587.1 DUF2135 domain-containing protein [Spirochaetales bacterium]